MSDVKVHEINGLFVKLRETGLSGEETERLSNLLEEDLNVKNEIRNEVASELYANKEMRNALIGGELGALGSVLIPPVAGFIVYELTKSPTIAACVTFGLYVLGIAEYYSSRDKSEKRLKNFYLDHLTE